MAAKRAKVGEAPDPLQHARRLRDLIAELGGEAMRFTSPSKVEEAAHRWQGRGGPSSIPTTPGVSMSWRKP